MENENGANDSQQSIENDLRGENENDVADSQQSIAGDLNEETENDVSNSQPAHEQANANDFREEIDCDVAVGAALPALSAGNPEESNANNLSDISDGMLELSLQSDHMAIPEETVDEKPAKMEQCDFLNAPDEVIEVFSDDEDEMKPLMASASLSTVEWSAIEFIVTEESASETQQSIRLSDDFEFSAPLPPPTEAKLQFDARSGQIPYTEDVCTLVVLMIQFHEF